MSRSLSLRLGIGIVLLAVGTTILLALSLPGGSIPGVVGSLAVVLVALGTLGVGTSGNRSV